MNSTKSWEITKEDLFNNFSWDSSLKTVGTATYNI